MTQRDDEENGIWGLGISVKMLLNDLIGSPWQYDNTGVHT